MRASEYRWDRTVDFRGVPGSTARCASVNHPEYDEIDTDSLQRDNPLACWVEMDRWNGMMPGQAAPIRVSQP